MSLIIEPMATVLANYALLSRGELLVGLQGRQWVPTERHPPGAEARANADDNARAQLLLDDGSVAASVLERVHYLPNLPSSDAPYRVGTQLRGIAGVLDQRGGSYRLHPSSRVEVVQAPRPESAPEVAGEIRVASMNVLNFFNGDGKGGGFPTARGASDAEELTRQRAKILSALKAMDADVYALIEIENDGYDKLSAIAELTARLNQARGRPREYDYIRGPEAQLGSDLISVGLLYRTRKLKPVGAAATLTEAPFDALSRAPLVQTFDVIKTGARFTVAVNHFKSKGGCDRAEGGDRDLGDGQGCWNATRVAAARMLADWLASDPTGSGDPDVLIVGDLNAYSLEDPLRLLRESGYAASAHVDQQPHYSFVYDGLSGSLDHALASTTLANQVRGSAHWHINADELPEFDYNRENRPRALDARMFRSDPFRSSDHDPLIVGLTLDPPAPELPPMPEPAKLIEVGKK
jgi:predicted extracellular nuclease